MTWLLGLAAKNPLAVGLGILSLLLAVVSGTQTLRLAWAQQETTQCQKDRADDNNRALLAADQQRREDIARREEIDANHKLDLIRTRQEISKREEAINNAAPSNVCGGAPAYRAYYDSVQQEQRARAAGGGQARPR